MGSFHGNIYDRRDRPGCCCFFPSRGSLKSCRIRPPPPPRNFMIDSLKGVNPDHFFLGWTCHTPETHVFTWIHHISMLNRSYAVGFFMICWKGPCRSFFFLKWTNQIICYFVIGPVWSEAYFALIAHPPTTHFYNQINIWSRCFIMLCCKLYTATYF